MVKERSSLALLWLRTIARLAMSRPHASSVDADNAWGPPPEAAQPEEAFSAADVQAKEQIILCVPPSRFVSLTTSLLD